MARGAGGEVVLVLSYFWRACRLAFFAYIEYLIARIVGYP